MWNYQRKRARRAAGSVAADVARLRRRAALARDNLSGLDALHLAIGVPRRWPDHEAQVARLRSWWSQHGHEMPAGEYEWAERTFGQSAVEEEP